MARIHEDMHSPSAVSETLQQFTKVEEKIMPNNLDE